VYWAGLTHSAPPQVSRSLASAAVESPVTVTLLISRVGSFISRSAFFARLPLAGLMD
jgi:hypothetical protein